MKNSKGVRTTITPITPAQGVLKADTNQSWGTPLGLGLRACNDENLVIFRRALGINLHRPTSEGCTLEDGRKTATGIYKAIISAQRKRAWEHLLLSMLHNFCLFAQIIVGAALTALGPSAANHPLAITILGASNTVIAGVVALIKGQGLPERLRKDEIEFRKVQDWVEETESLLAVGIIGRNRQEVGLLVEVAFKKYNAAKASMENNRPEAYITQRDDDDEDDNPKTKGSAMVRLNLRSQGSKTGTEAV
jgi:hypothetical protein